MNKHPREEELALYATKDLPRDELFKIDEHLTACPACRECLQDLDQCQEMLRGSRIEPAQQDLIEVRREIMRRVGRRRSSSWRWKWSAGLAAAGAALILALYWHLPSPESKPLLSPTIALTPESSKMELPPIERVRVARRAPQSFAPGLRSVTLIKRGDEPPLIRMNTSDPSVVILLQTGEMKSNERTQNNE